MSTLPQAIALLREALDLAEAEEAGRERSMSQEEQEGWPFTLGDRIRAFLKGTYEVSQVDGSTHVVIHADREWCVCSDYDGFEDSEARARQIAAALNGLAPTGEEQQIG